MLGLSFKNSVLYLAGLWIIAVRSEGHPSFLRIATLSSVTAFVLNIVPCTFVELGKCLTPAKHTTL